MEREKEKRLESINRKKERKAKQKLKKFNSPKSSDKRLLKKWREECISKWGDKCYIFGCDKTPVNMHHIIGRRNKQVRYDVDNGCPLCSKHHVFDKLSAHQNPLEFIEFLKQVRGEEWYNELRRRSNVC